MNLFGALGIGFLLLAGVIYFMHTSYLENDKSSEKLIVIIKSIKAWGLIIMLITMSIFFLVKAFN